MLANTRSPLRGAGTTHRGRSALAALGIAPLVLLGSCDRTAPQSDAEVTRYGVPVGIGDGLARTYVTVRDGLPTEVGVALSAAVLHGLPADDDPHGILMPDGHRTFEYVLEMPPESATPFQHVTVDWNPVGHEPTGVYYVPHFDVHFYTITNDERLTISPDDPSFVEKALRYPPAEQVPAGFVAVSDGVPLMGVHWAAQTAPEFNGAPFRHSLLTGSWDGRLIFVEPMVTKAFLETRPDFVGQLSLPSAYASPGRYPSTYGIRWDEGAAEYRISLGGLTDRS